MEIKAVSDKELRKILLKERKELVDIKKNNNIIVEIDPNYAKTIMIENRKNLSKLIYNKKIK